VPLAQRGEGFGIPSLRVDGNDVVACHAATKAALDRARAGGGPAFIEAVTYRMGAHTTADDPTRYRPDSEAKAWSQRDPIARLRAHLEAQGLADAAFLADCAAQAAALAERVRAACLALEPPRLAAAFARAYAAPHPLVAEEAAWWRAYSEDLDPVAPLGGGR
jgi:pyruvate dehydrogenase E1 component alpha subunit